MLRADCQLLASISRMHRCSLPRHRCDGCSCACHRGNRAVLTPLDEAYALRPSLAHMSSSKGEADAKGKAAAEDDEDEKPPDPQPVTVSCLLLCIMEVFPYCGVRTAVNIPQEERAAGNSVQNMSCLGVQVQVKRRETERQQESRLNSYAYLAEQERQEPWCELQAIPPQTSIIDTMLYRAVEDDVPMELSQQDYSCAILPGVAPLACRASR